MKINAILLISLSIILISISSVSALVSCDSSTIQKSWTSGSSVSTSAVTCVNNGNSSVIISKVGSYFSTSTPVDISASETKTLTISFEQNAPAGSYQGVIYFSDSSPSVNINMSVQASQSQTYSIIVFPTSKMITVQQGQTKQQTIQIIVPSTYPRILEIHSLSFDPDINVVTFGDLDLGLLNPGQTVNIPIKVDATNAQTGIYETKISIIATDSNGQVPMPDVNLQVSVQAGINPSTNNTFSVKPVCSVSAVDMALNLTYSFTCTNTMSNIQVNVPYNDFFEGLGADLSSGIYTYRFKPIKMGNTKFMASFSYMGSAIFDAYEQDVRISSYGNTVAGTNLKILFNPALNIARDGDTVIIQLVDNRSGSMVASPELYVDSMPSNNSQNSFYKVFHVGKTYNLRARSPGYDDLVMEVELTSKDMVIAITPASGDSETDFVINTTAENASLFLNGNPINNPYNGKLPAGINEVRAIKEGFFEKILNITIEEAITILQIGEWKKGVPTSLTLNKNITWNLVYKKTATSEKSSLTSGIGGLIEFTPEKSGFYFVESDGKTRWSNNIPGGGLAWYWWALIIIGGGIVTIYLIKSMSNKSEREETVGFMRGNQQN